MAAKIKAGILGIDHAHGPGVYKILDKHEDYELVGVAEPDAAVRKAYEPRLEGAKWVEAEALLDDPDVQMIAVESHVPRLLELADRAVAAGKHIHLDKPAGTDLPAFRKLLDSAEEQDLLVQMGYMYRYNPGFDRMRHAMQQGWLGDIYSINASMCTNLGAEKRKELDFHKGGMVLELGCHLIDMIVFMLGEPREVTPFLRHDGNFQDALMDNTLSVLQYDHALVTIAIGAMEPHAFGGRRFKAVGPNGSAILMPIEPPELRLALQFDNEELDAGVHTEKLPDLPRHQRDFTDLAQCVRGEKAFAFSKKHDYNVQRTILRASGMDV